LAIATGIPPDYWLNADPDMWATAIDVLNERANG